MRQRGILRSVSRTTYELELLTVARVESWHNQNLQNFANMSPSGSVYDIEDNDGCCHIFHEKPSHKRDQINGGIKKSRVNGVSRVTNVGKTFSSKNESLQDCSNVSSNDKLIQFLSSDPDSSL